MKYYTGEEVQLYDKVELDEGDAWVKATVIFISGVKTAAEECMWLMDENPEWADGQIAILWDCYEYSDEGRYVVTSFGEKIDQGILFTDTEENDELRFVARKS